VTIESWTQRVTHLESKSMELKERLEEAHQQRRGLEDRARSSEKSLTELQENH
jgi:hypothetical protein